MFKSITSFGVAKVCRDIFILFAADEKVTAPRILVIRSGCNTQRSISDSILDHKGGCQCNNKIQY